MPHVVLLGTMDTKSSELSYLRSQLFRLPIQPAHPLRVTLIDCGRSAVDDPFIDISIPKLSQPRASLDRGSTVKFLIEKTTKQLRELVEKDPIHGVVSAGGSGGTSLVSAAMRDAVPIGVPKLIVSTVASGTTDHIIGESDITLMYPIVDIAGMNSLIERELSNAAGAMAGMATMYELSQQPDNSDKTTGGGTRPKKRIGITMFGVTTQGVTKIQEYLQSQHPEVEVYIFHATGHGGRAMERLVEEGKLDAVLDLTTTEIADQIVGGVMSAGSARLETALRRGIPNIISLGAVDMVNFGPRNTVPAAFTERKLLEHNPSVTLMRTSKEECIQIGDFISNKILECAAKPENVQIWIPMGGVSALSVPGGAFDDAAAAQALRDTIVSNMSGSKVRIVEEKRDVNDEGFALDITKALLELLKE